MKKVPSLYKRDYDGTHQVYDDVVPGSEWVLSGEGVATEKIDGTACLIEDGVFYKRYDRRKQKKTGRYKPVPDGWVACEEHPNEHTGHWPGWLPVDENHPTDRWHIEAFANGEYDDGTYELVGPKVQGNAHGYNKHLLIKHGANLLEDIPVTFEGIRLFLMKNLIEGIVWHHPDGRMCKIKRRDFGFTWPIKKRQ